MSPTKQQKEADSDSAETASGYHCKALVLQGGGALGAYQAGAYQALSEADHTPDWVAGISIGAINAALIAGNPPDRQVESLRHFWEEITRAFDWPAPTGGVSREMFNTASSMGAAMLGVPSFFRPRVPGSFLRGTSIPESISFYDTSPLLETLNRYIDFDRLNRGAMRLSLGAVDIESGNNVVFDNSREWIGPRHILASGSLPPGFPPTEINGRMYWDGGVLSNTPLGKVLREMEAHVERALIFQVDLWNARGRVPCNMFEAESRRKSIVYSSRTRLNTDLYRREAEMRANIKKLGERLSPQERQDPAIAAILALGQDRQVDLVHIIYKQQTYETSARDYEFSRASMRNHWKAGRKDVNHTLDHPEWQSPTQTASNGIRVFDLV